jgi:hypothetical protein
MNWFDIKIVSVKTKAIWSSCLSYNYLESNERWHGSVRGTEGKVMWS